MNRTACRAAAAVALLAVTWPGAAYAHTDLLGSTPRDGDTVSARTARLVLTFTDEVRADAAQVVVRDPQGEDVVASRSTTRDDTVEVPLDLRLPGRHLATYRVVSADGHVVVGDVRFEVSPPVAPRSPRERAGATAADRTVSLPTPSPPSPPPSSAADGGVVPPVWWAGGVLLAGGAVLVLREVLSGTTTGSRRRR